MITAKPWIICLVGLMEDVIEWIDSYSDSSGCETRTTTLDIPLTVKQDIRSSSYVYIENQTLNMKNAQSR